MQGAPTQFWGKLREAASGAPEAWHPLVHHCADVAACCEALLADVVIRRRLARLAGLNDLDAVQSARLCYLAAIHDAGKFNHGFQAKAVPEARDTEGHVTPLFEAIGADDGVLAQRVQGALRVDLVQKWGADDLLFAALAHHGRPVALGDVGRGARPVLWQVRGDRDPVAGMAALASRALAWFPEALMPGSEFPGSPALGHAFSGLVTWADWIASDDDLFPFSEDPLFERIEDARRLAANAVNVIGLDASSARDAMGAPPAFEEAFGYSPRPAQRAVIDLPAIAGGSLVVLEAETGAGKTEAALAHFYALFAVGEVDGLYFALPTRTAATQIHERVRRSVARVFPKEACRPPVILAVPGYVQVDDAKGSRGDPRLPPFKTLWPDDGGDRIRWRGWAAESPKRYLAGAIAVGTIDQALMSSLTAKHAHFRATSLLRQLLVVDEVHASDAYMNRILESVIDRHLAAGGHAMLMSATLGGTTRERFLSAGTKRPTLAEAERTPFPNVVSARAGRAEGDRCVASIRSLDEVQHGKSVTVELAAIGSDAQAIGGRAAQAARDGARVIVIRNKVDDAVRTQVAVETALGDPAFLFSCGGRAAPHHSRYTREDRIALDREMEAAFGKGRKGKGCVAVATQTVQQSLDLDADLLLTDICPMDVLLQRIGRLHRHADSERPPGYRKAKVIVLVPPVRDLTCAIGRRGAARGPVGLGSVYEDLRTIEATWRELESRAVIEIPAMNRTLVERTTHPEALDRITHQMGGPWLEHRNLQIGALAARKIAAGNVLMDWSEHFGERGFPPEIEAAAASRLGTNDRIAQFEAPWETPFGNHSIAITVPGWVCHGVAEDARPELIEQDVSVGRLRFRFGTLEFVYDRLGLRRAERNPTGGEDGNG
jgi:CRISPR-associated endonuclease/helicase Cas3